MHSSISGYLNSNLFDFNELKSERIDKLHDILSFKYQEKLYDLYYQNCLSKENGVDFENGNPDSLCPLKVESNVKVVKEGLEIVTHCECIF